VVHKRQVELDTAKRLLRQEAQWLDHATKHEIKMRERLTEDELDEVHSKMKNFGNGRQATVGEAINRSTSIPATLPCGEKVMQASARDSNMPFNANIAQQFMAFMQQMTSNMQAGAGIGGHSEHAEGPPAKKVKGVNDDKRTENHPGNNCASGEEHISSDGQMEPGLSEAQLFEKHTMSRG